MLAAVPPIDLRPLQLLNAILPIVASVSLEMLSESPSSLQLLNADSPIFVIAALRVISPVRTEQPEKAVLGISVTELSQVKIHKRDLT